MRTHYTGRTASAGYHCAGKSIVNGRGVYCLSVGAVQIDEAVARAVLAALAPLGVEAALAAAERSKPIAMVRWRSGVSRSSAQATRRNAPSVATRRRPRQSPRRPLASKPNGRTACANSRRPRPNSRVANSCAAERSAHDERIRLLALGADLLKAWQAPTTSPRDKKELLRTLLEEVIITVHKDQRRAHLTLRWRGSALTDIDLDLPRPRPAIVRTDEDTIALVRRLAIHYPDAVIAGILNRQERKTAYGHRFTANLVGNLRRHWNIPRFEPPANPPEGELLNIKQIAAALGVATSTIHRWLNDGIIAGEQLTPGAPWRIRLTDDLRARVAEEAPDGFLTMYQTMRLLGVSRQTVWQRVKRGEIEAAPCQARTQKRLAAQGDPLSIRPLRSNCISWGAV